jgi:hypothetical protein
MERLFFYNATDGSAALGTLAEEDFATEHSFAAGTFGAGSRCSFVQGRDPRVRGH